MATSGPYRYDLFISHAAADRAWVEGYLAEALSQAGVRWHAEAAFPPDSARLTECERAIETSQRVALVLSPAYLAEGFADVVALLARQYGPGGTVWPVSPILLQPVTLPARLPTLPTLDASDARKWPRVINRLCSELGHPLRGPVQRPPCPYPGLRAFGATDVPRFYGRDGEIGTLLGHLRHGRFVLVSGPAGAGKTSVVQAGLLPQLPASLHWPPGFWLARTLRPGAHPLRALAATLAATHGSPREALTDLLAAHFPAGRLLLVVDPLDELFTLADAAEQEVFLAALQELRADARCALVLVLRDDFMPDLMTSPLWPIGVHQRVEIAPLRGPALRQAIQQPALQAGVQVEGDLLARLLADAAPEPDPLPLVQETLVGLWGAMDQRLLALRPYQQVARGGPNGLATAFAARVDATFRALDPAQQALAQRLVLCLVQPGEGRPDLPRPQTVGVLAGLEDDPAAVPPLLRYLATNRLLTLDGLETDADTLVDLAHATLIVRWPRLRGWLRERRTAWRERRTAGPPTHAWVRRPVTGDAPAMPPPAPAAPPAAPTAPLSADPVARIGEPLAPAPLPSAPVAPEAALPAEDGPAADPLVPAPRNEPAPPPPDPAPPPVEIALPALIRANGKAHAPVAEAAPSAAPGAAAAAAPAAPRPLGDTPGMITIRPLARTAVAALGASPARPPGGPATLLLERAGAPSPPEAAPDAAIAAEAAEREQAREQAIQAARARLAHLAILRVEEEQFYSVRAVRLRRLRRAAVVGAGVLVLLALLAGVVWLGWGVWW